MGTGTKCVPYCARFVGARPRGSIRELLIRWEESGKENPSPPSVFFARVASKGLTGAMVVRVATAGLKSVCFHTDSRRLVSVDTSMI